MLKFQIPSHSEDTEVWLKSGSLAAQIYTRKETLTSTARHSRGAPHFRFRKKLRKRKFRSPASGGGTLAVRYRRGAWRKWRQFYAAPKEAVERWFLLISSKCSVNLLSWTFWSKSLLLCGLLRWEANIYLPNKLKMASIKHTGNRFVPKAQGI